MKNEREIVAYKNYFLDFIKSLKSSEAKKIYYILDLLKTQERISTKFVKHLQEGLYEIRAEYEGNIYRIFFCFDEGRIVVLFNGFQKKSQKTPKSEIEKALKIKAEYYESK
ncbi:MAG: type II toxin-antitoxin system RelE/ParE family toxin [Rikenellaceae bacterium]